MQTGRRKTEQNELVSRLGDTAAGGRMFSCTGAEAPGSAQIISGSHFMDKFSPMYQSSPQGPSHAVDSLTNVLVLCTDVLASMSTPQLDDDGRVVTLDLHGATVEEAIDLTYRTLRLAEERGRSRLRLIHGSSTTQAGDRRTIKNALHDLLDRGKLGAHATNVIRQRDTLVLALDVTAGGDGPPIHLHEVQR